MNEFDILRQKILQAKSILISSHVGPDGDAIGSSLAVYHYLKSKGINSTIVVPTAFPDFLNWLPDSDTILVHEKKRSQSEEAAKNADLIFCLDYNETKRVAKFQPSIDNSSAFKVLIDHHIGEPTWPNLNLSVVGASSTCELVFDMLFELENRNLDFLNTDIAHSIYTGLLTDTGNFQFSATSPKVHTIASFLLSAGVKPDIVNNYINNSFSENRLKFFGYCVSEKMKFVKSQNLAYTFVTSAELKKYNITTGGTEGLVNEPMKIDGIDISVLFKEDDDRIKISFRSKRDLDVSTFANKFFEGGGHLNAAGGVSFLSLEETEQFFLDLIKDYKF
jgi:phosphoesterase RecJ-like protein